LLYGDRGVLLPVRIERCCIAKIHSAPTNVFAAFHSCFWHVLNSERTAGCLNRLMCTSIRELVFLFGSLTRGVTESGLQAEKVGKFYPADWNKRSEVHQWLFFLNAGLGPMQGPLHTCCPKHIVAIHPYIHLTQVRDFQIVAGW
jgi:hypothetical protein